jgi:hypothetical protein
MIVPTKGIEPDQTLLFIGAQVLSQLAEPGTVSGLWDKLRADGAAKAPSAPLTYDRFVLSLDLLYAMGVIDLVQGQLVRMQARPEPGDVPEIFG